MLREFITLTQTGEKTALACLTQHDWKLDSALDNYFANPDFYFRDHKPPSVDKKRLDQFYSKYRGQGDQPSKSKARKPSHQTVVSFTDANEPSKIGMNGVVQLLEDLQLDPSSRTVLLLAWKLKAATQCEFSREEFINGMIEMG